MSSPFPPITAVVSFCSNDWRFFKRCVESLFPFCQQVIITVCDRFFDGSEENYALLEAAFAMFPSCTFLLFTFDAQATYRPFSPLFLEHPDWRHEWHNTGRHISYFYAPADTEFLFFVDCDEVVDAEKLMQWLRAKDLSSFDAIRFAGNWHFREAQYEATTQADVSLLVRKSAIGPNDLWDEDERMGIFLRVRGEKERQVMGLDGKPMVQHWGGVRPKEEFKKKLTTWGHHWERNWEAIVEAEFSRPFSGTDFMRGYAYRPISVAFDPLLEDIPQLNPISYEEHLNNLSRFQNVIMVSKSDLLKKQLIHEFQIKG